MITIYSSTMNKLTCNVLQINRNNAMQMLAVKTRLSLREISQMTCGELSLKIGSLYEFAFMHPPLLVSVID